MEKLGRVSVGWSIVIVSDVGAGMFAALGQEQAKVSHTICQDLDAPCWANTLSNVGFRQGENHPGPGALQINSCELGCGDAVKARKLPFQSGLRKPIGNMALLT